MAAKKCGKRIKMLGITSYLTPDLDLDFGVWLAYDRAPLWFNRGAMWAADPKAEDYVRERFKR